MFFLPSVECGKFKLKQAFQSGKISACSTKSEICATSTLKLIKMMLKCRVAQASSASGTSIPGEVGGVLTLPKICIGGSKA